MNRKKIYVTRPSLPSLNRFQEYLADIWETKYLTNYGKYHIDFEHKLGQFLNVDNICLCANGTLALINALQVLRITGEVITTPYSFVASTHALHWNNIQPVFCDIDPNTMNLNPDKIESLITPKTTAILAVHVYGNPCNVDAIQKIADTYGLKVIYDAAHAFGVKIKGNSILKYGDISVLSFHATKLLTTMEGGAIVCHDDKTKQRIKYLQNFGFADEVTVMAPGINAKMNEMQAALGILQLENVTENIKKRRFITNQYRNSLKHVKGIYYLEDIEDVEHNYQYFPIFVNEDEYGKKRDELYKELQKYGIFGRRYFYPIISEFPVYRNLISASEKNLPIATKKSRQVVCLPLYPDIESDIVFSIINIIEKFNK